MIAYLVSSKKKSPKQNKTFGITLKVDGFILLAQSLMEAGESLKQMADIKYSLDDNVKQNFLEPLHHLQTKDLKEVMVSINSF